MGRETGIEPRDFQLGKLNRRLKIQTFASMGLIADDPKLWIPQYVRHRAKKGDRFHRRGGTPFNSLVGPDVVRSSTADSGFSSMGSPFRQKSRRRQTTPAHPVRQGRFRPTYVPAMTAPRCPYTGARQFGHFTRKLAGPEYQLVIALAVSISTQSALRERVEQSPSPTTVLPLSPVRF